MAESTDKRTRQIAEKRVEKGQEFERYQEAQNQLLAIQAEQQQNLAIQRNQAQNVMEQNQTLAQAAEIMALDDLNPQTQQVLSGYGLNQPRVIKNSDVKRQGPTNITINNTTINNTSGPVQGREVSIRPQEAGQGRFKAWLTNVFARQDALFQKQNQEYIRRENSLTRNANKMLRKLDGIGKDIGKALDPRRIADTERNRIKTLATIIGIPLLIKYLPKLFDSLNNISVKIKDIFTGENGILAKIKDGMTSEDGWLSTLFGEIYNNQGSGWLNKLLRNLQEKLFKRAEFATRGIEDISWKKPGKQVVKWLQLFFGGPEAGMRLEKDDIERDFIDELKGPKLNELNESLRATDRNMATITKGGTAIDLKSSLGRFGITSTDGSASKINNKEYQDWLVANNKKPSMGAAKEYLDTVKKFAYTGESEILTKKVYDNTKDRVLNPVFDLIGKHLRLGSHYPELVTSLEIIHEIKRGYGGGGNYYDKIKREKAQFDSYIGWENTMHNHADSSTNTSNLQTYLTLLIDKSKITNILVFPEFITLLTNKETETELNIKRVRIKLVRARLELGQEQIYWKKGTKGLSDYYKKIVVIGEKEAGDIDPTPIALPELDFKNRKNSKEWEMCELTNEQLGTILEKIFGSSTISYTTEDQKKLQDSIIGNVQSRGLTLGNKTPTFNIKEHNTYEELSREATQQRLEKESIDEQKKLKREAEKTAKWDREDSRSYMKSDSSSINQGIPRVNYAAESSEFSSRPTQEDLERAPRVSGNQPKHVTEAFGGNGTLTSNFMEWRGHRYHYGVDLHNNAGDKVRFPGNGNITGYGGEGGGKYIDITDDNNYVTRYYHTRLYGGLKRGDRVTPGQVIGITQSRSENGGEYDPHIHVEVHDPNWTKSDQHRHYVNPLVYWNEHKADNIYSAAPEYLRSPRTNNSLNYSQATSSSYDPSFLGASGGKGDAPNVTPNIERHSPAYNPSSTAISQRKTEQMDNGVNEDRQILLSALGIIADNTAETAHILRNTDKNIASIGGAVSRPTPKVSPAVPSVQTNNP